MNRFFRLAVLLLLFVPAISHSGPGTGLITPKAALDRLEAKANAAGGIPIIIQLQTPALPALQGPGERHRAPDDARHRLDARRVAIEHTQDLLAAAIGKQPARFRYLPLAAMSADGATIRRLRALPEVLSINEDLPHEPILNVSVPRIGGGTAYSQGYTGATAGNLAVAVLDTGVQTSHPSFAGRVLDEASACFSGTLINSVTSLCPNLSPCPAIVAADAAAPEPNGIYPENSACGSGAGIPCSGGVCWHGTHVAGIAVGNNGTYRGVAPGAHLIPIQVFAISDGSLVAYDSDIIAGLEHVLSLSYDGYDIAAVNMSLGGGTYSSTYQCDIESAATKTAIDALRAAGIATVIAAGNDGTKTGISTPACISTAVSVGATDNTDAIAAFSELAPTLSVFAPGVGITSSVPTNTFGTASGTSMATPHVAGAFALLWQKAGEAALEPSVDNLLASLRLSGLPLTYGTNAYSTPRIRLDQALALIGPSLPVELIMDSQVSPTGVSIVSGSFTNAGDVNAYGGSALRGISTDTPNTLRFAPSLAAGYYELSVWWPAGSSNPTQASVAIGTASGTEQINVNQQQNGGRWNVLGIFRFDPAQSAPFVEISGIDPSSGVLADAVRFRRVVDNQPTLTSAPATVSAANLGTYYFQQFQASGGVPPYSWRLIGTLPPGLSFDPTQANLSGSPTQTSEPVAFTLEIHDAVGTAGTAAYQIAVEGTANGADKVWIEDSVPAGSTLFTNSDSWTWVGSNPAPFSKTSAHRSALASGIHQHYFRGATTTLSVGNNQRLFTYVYINPANPPRELMLQWYSSLGWAHRAYWGEDLIAWGTAGTAQRRYLGSLPPAGKWVRLEIPADVVGLEGYTVTGMAFTLYDGQVTWDYSGVGADVIPPPPIPHMNLSGRVTVAGNPLSGVTLQSTADATCSKTDAGGSYTCSVPSGWSGTLTPQLSGYEFTPTSRSYTNVAADQTAQDYIAASILVWVEDSVPAGSTLVTNADSWTWISTNPSPFSKSLAHRSDLISGLHQHYFRDTPTPITVRPGQSLFTYVYINPANPPREIMLQWNSAQSGWAHRAYWGENLIAWGVSGSSERRHMGPLPQTGQWILLTVPANLVGLEGYTIKGMAYTLYDGQATWDYSGLGGP